MEENKASTTIEVEQLKTAVETLRKSRSSAEIEGAFLTAFKINPLKREVTLTFSVNMSPQVMEQMKFLQSIGQEDAGSNTLTITPIQKRMF